MLLSFVSPMLLGKDSELYLYIFLGADCLLALDAILSILVLRFWGKHSYTNCEWHPIANLLATGLLLGNPMMYLLIDADRPLIASPSAF